MMSSNQASNYKLISCVIPGHKSKPLMQKLLDEMGVATANKNNVRGESKISGHIYEEMEMLSILIEEKRAEEVFEFIYFEVEIFKPHHGFMYCHPVSRSSEFVLPKL